jgi:hypothetical protein
MQYSFFTPSIIPSHPQFHQRSTQNYLFSAAEIKNTADVKAAYIVRIANADAYANKSMVDMQGLRGMCSSLGITDMEEKLSVYMLKTFGEMDNLFMAPGWTNASIYAGRGSA